jgi:hypothetical protein
MTRILIGVVIATLSGGVSKAVAYDQATLLGARWYCLMQFKMAGMSPLNSDPMFQNCIRKRATQATKEWDGQAAAAQRENQRRQQQLRQLYGN